MVAWRVLIWEVIAVSGVAATLAALLWDGLDRRSILQVAMGSLLLAMLFPYGIADDHLLIVWVLDLPWFNSMGDSGGLGHLVLIFVMIPFWVLLFGVVMLLRACVRKFAA